MMLECPHCGHRCRVARAARMVWCHACDKPSLVVENDDGTFIAREVQRRTLVERARRT